MEYLMIICHDEKFYPTEPLVADIIKWNNEMTARGIVKDGNPLRPPNDGVTIRIREGKRKVTKGPFSASREQMAAYELIECAGFDEAIEVASTHPMAKAATIEVRPVWSDLGR
jgi:hypothetical protein